MPRPGVQPRRPPPKTVRLFGTGRSTQESAGVPQPGVPRREPVQPALGSWQAAHSHTPEHGSRNATASSRCHYDHARRAVRNFPEDGFDDVTRSYPRQDAQFDSRELVPHDALKVSNASRYAIDMRGEQSRRTIDARPGRGSGAHHGEPRVCARWVEPRSPHDFR